MSDKPEKAIRWIKSDDEIEGLIYASDTPIEGWTRVEFDGVDSYAKCLHMPPLTDSSWVKK
jgi:hypothetical protein